MLNQSQRLTSGQIAAVLCPLALIVKSLVDLAIAFHVGH